MKSSVGRIRTLNLLSRVAVEKLRHGARRYVCAEWAAKWSVRRARCSPIAIRVQLNQRLNFCARSVVFFDTKGVQRANA